MEIKNNFIDDKYEDLNKFFSKNICKFYKYLLKIFNKKFNRSIKNIKNFKKEYTNNFNNQIFYKLFDLIKISKKQFINSLNRSFVLYRDFNIPLNIINHSIVVALNSFLILFLSILNYNLLNVILYYNKYSISNNKKVDINIKIDRKKYLISEIKKISNFTINLFNNLALFEKFINNFILACLLHDIAKFIEIRENYLNNKEINHAEKGYIILKDLGFPFGAILCRDHLIKDFNGNISIPSKILNLSDKMVKHSKIVSIEERFVDLKKRYQKYADKFSKNNLIMYENYTNLLFNTCKLVGLKILSKNHSTKKIFKEKINIKFLQKKLTCKINKLFNCFEKSYIPIN